MVVPCITFSSLISVVFPELFVICFANRGKTRGAGPQGAAVVGPRTKPLLHRATTTCIHGVCPMASSARTVSLQRKTSETDVSLSLNLDGTGFAPLAPNALALEDRWILSRLQNACVTIDKNLNGYNPSAAIATARDLRR